MTRLVMLRMALLVVGVVAAPGWASAHAVGVEAKWKGDRVSVETYYDDDTPAVAAKVRVVAEDGTAVAEGKTDDKGQWSFPTPPPGKYRIAIDAGAGHLAKTTLTIPPRELAPQPLAAPSSTNESGPAVLPSEVVVTEGPTRDEMTGPQRWLKAAVGLGLIAALTALARLATRKRHLPSGSEAP